MPEDSMEIQRQGIGCRQRILRFFRVVCAVAGYW